MQHLVTSEFEFFTEKTGWGEKVENRDVIHPPKCAVYIILFHEEFGVCTCWAQIYKYFVFILKYINGNKIFPFSHLGHGELKIFACVLL